MLPYRNGIVKGSIQHQVEVRFEQVPHRLSEYPGAPNGDPLDIGALKPLEHPCKDKLPGVLTNNGATGWGRKNV